MYNPNDVLKVSEENWEEFKKEACKDELFYRGEGDLLDTAEGRSKFCRLISPARRSGCSTIRARAWSSKSAAASIPL